MREIKKKSPVPVYAAAGAWLIYSMFGPMYKLWHFILAAAITAAMYIAISKVCPGTVIVVEEPKEETELDRIKREEKTAIAEFRRLRESIKNDSVRRRIDELCGLSEKIVANLDHDPEDLPQTKKFLNYYQPTTIKLLNAYDRMYVQGIEGENIGGTMNKIEEMLDTIVAAWQKQLDALFANEALDIETDIEVMEGMLKRGGLKNDEFNNK